MVLNSRAHCALAYYRSKAHPQEEQRKHAAEQKHNTTVLKDTRVQHLAAATGVSLFNVFSSFQSRKMCFPFKKGGGCKVFELSS